MSEELAEAAVKAFDAGAASSEALNQVAPVIQYSMGRLSNILWDHDRIFREYLLLCNDLTYTRYLFISERGKTTCKHCIQTMT